MQKKKFTFLLIMMLLLTGCTKITNDIDSIVDNIFSSDKAIVNTVSTCYEVYLPVGVKQVSDHEYNQKFKIRNTYIYLYVDTISYYYKNTLNYKYDDDYDYYFKNLKLDDKIGYIGINKSDKDLYYVNIVYNYSKIEFYANYEDLPYILANSLIIVKSIKYNDNLISMKLSDNGNDGREVKYQLDSPKNTESTFSDYLQEYVPDETPAVELPDEN